MHRNSPQRIPALPLLAALVFGSFAATPCYTHAAVLTWDANGATTGAQDGSGTWTTGSAGWWNGTSGTTWIANDQAVFGAGTPGTYTITIGGNIQVASGSAANGGLNFLTSGYTLSAASARTITVGNSTTSGVVRVVSATATIGSNVTVAKNTGTGGVAVLGGGTLKVDAGGVLNGPNANVSEVAGGSTLWMNGGSATFATSVVIGQFTSGVGTGGNLLVDSGTFSVGGTGNFILSRTTGDVSTATVNGGAITVAAGNLAFASGAITGTSTFNLNGGSITVRQVSYGGGTATFNFNGGTLKAQTSGSSAFMSGLTRANVRNGGAVFDSNGQSITVGQALLHSNIGGDNAIDGGLTLNDTAGTKGTLTLTGANTYTGTTSVRAGTLAYGANNVIAAGDVSVDGSAAVLSIGGFSDTVGAVAVKNGGAITGSTGVLTGTAYLLESGSVGAILGGSGALTKTTSGTVTLTNANTLSGATTVSAGMLRLAGAGSLSSSAVTVNGAGAAFRADSSAPSTAITLEQGTVTGSGTVGAISVGNSSAAIISNNGGVAGAAFTTGTLTFAGASNLNLFVSDTTPALVAGGLPTNAAGVVAVNPSAASWNNGATYNLLTYGGGSVGGAGFGQFALGTVGGLTVRQAATAFTDTGSAFTVSIVGDTPYWVGDGSGDWNTTAPNNWKLVIANTPTTFIQGDEVIFDDRVSGTGTAAVQINAADVGTFSTKFDNSTRDYSVSGPFGISAGTFTKTGTGTVTLATPNSYTGATSINAGTVVLSGSLGSTPITVAAGANFTQGGAGRIGGAASLATSGAVSLGGVNTYSGTTTVTSGTLAATAANALSPNSPVALGGGRLDLGGAPQSSGAVSITAAAASGDTIANGSLTAPSYAASHTTGRVVISANLLASGTTGFTMTGGGDATLSGSNTYTGPTTVSAGILRAGSSNAFTNKGTLALSSTARFDLNGFNASFTTFSGSSSNTVTTGGSGAGTDTLTISGLTAATGALFTDGPERALALAIDGTPTLDPLTNASNAFSGGLSLLNMRLSVVDNSATTGGRYGKGTITIGTGAQMYFNAANKTVSNNIVVNANSTVGSRTGAFRVDTAGQTLSGTITAAAADAMFNAGGGVAGMTLTGKVTGPSGLQARNSNGATSMTLVLNTPADANDYQGLTTIGDNSTVTLRLAAANQIPNGAGKGNVSVTGVLDLAGFDETVNSLSGAGTIDNVSAGTSNVLTIGDGNLSNTFSGAIRNTNGVLGLTKIGSGTQTLSGSSTYTGMTSVQNGSLRLQGSLSPSTSLSLGGATTSGKFVLGGTSAVNQTVAGLTTTGSGGSVVGGTSTVSTLTVSFASGTSVFAGTLGGGGTNENNLALTKVGTGTLALSGAANSYSGKTIVGAGTLEFVAGAASHTAAQSLGAHADVDLGVAGTSSGRLRYTGAAGTLAKNVNALGNSQNVIENAGTGLLTLSGTLTKNGTILTLAGNAYGINVTGAIVGSSANSDLDVDGGTTTLSTANSYNGPTFIFNGATLNANAANALPTANGRTAILLDQTGSGTSSLVLGVDQAISSLTGASNSAVNLGGNALTVGTSSGSTTFAGVISGIGGSMVKDGISTLVLSGSNTYTGPTTVSAGGLSVNGALASGNVSVGQNAWLGGSGSIAGAVAISGTLTPGNGPGLLTMGLLSVDATSTTQIEFTDSLVRGTGYDGIDITTSGGLTYGGLLSLAFGNTSAFTDNTTLSIFGFTGSAAGAFSSVTSTGFYAGTWTNVGSGTFQLQKDSQTLTFSQASGDIIVVPEPSTLALVGLGGFLAAVALRRRQA